MWDAPCRNGAVATMTAGASAPVGLIEDGAVAAEGARIAWIGAESALPGPSGMGAPNESFAIDELLHVVRTHTLSAFDYLSRA
jgi:hypothetical protein